MSEHDRLTSLTTAEKRALLEQLARRQQQGGDAEPLEFDRWPEIVELRGRIAELAAWGVDNPTFIVHEAPCGTTTRVDGRELLNFYHYNYLGARARWCRRPCPRAPHASASS